VVQPNTTVLLRVINAALNTHLFFKVAGHNFTVVAVDACYTANYTTDTLVLAPGNTVDALIFTDAAPGSYYMAVQPHDTLSPSTMDTSDDDSTATAILLYNGTSATATPAMPTMPTSSDTTTANNFYFGLRGLAAEVPSPVDVNMTIELGLGQLPCDATQTSCAGNSFAAAMNGVSFRLPTGMSLLEAQFNRTPGVYTADFPDGVPPNGTAMVEGTKVRSVPYNSTVEIVLQNPTALPAENHPIHLHGFNFFVLAQGLGTFTPGNTSAYNLVDPVARNTIAVPTGGWAVIRFLANNPGTVLSSLLLG
jgi:laccase